MDVVSKTENLIWEEEKDNLYFQKPQSYVLRKDLRNATIDLLKSFLTKPKRAMDFPFWAYVLLFVGTLGIFSVIHSLEVFFSAESSIYSIKVYFTGTIRIFSATMLALIIALIKSTAVILFYFLL